MKILSAGEIRAWDEFTIQQEPVTPINLMERAASECTAWILRQYPDAIGFSIFCGKGNNGGDGLAIARMLLAKNYPVNIHILEFGHKGTDDFQTNLARLHQLPGVNLHFIQQAEHFPALSKDEVIIDALYGSGLNRGLEGVTANLVEHINASGCEIVSIDIPSGLFADHSSKGTTVVKANHTLTFQCYKIALLLPENAPYIGKVEILDIELHPHFDASLTTQYELIDEEIIRSVFKPRRAFSHKGNFGHALLLAGSYGKIGAAVLAASSCLRSGVGLLTVHIPKCGYDILQSTVPEAMVMTDFNSSFLTKTEVELTKYDAIGIGPGIGTAAETKTLLLEMLDAYRNPIVVDADALNIIAAQKKMLQQIPAGSILTPHPKEFERLFGETANDLEKIELAIQKSKEFNIIIVLKGHHTLIATPDGKGFFNSTGNAGMASGGSGDVLTGILTGLLAQGYTSREAALLGVYIHGLAGDSAAEILSMESMVASDIISNIGEAFKKVADE